MKRQNNARLIARSILCVAALVFLLPTNAAAQFNCSNPNESQPGPAAGWTWVTASCPSPPPYDPPPPDLEADYSDQFDGQLAAFVADVIEDPGIRCEDVAPACEDESVSEIGEVDTVLQLACDMPGILTGFLSQIGIKSSPQVRRLYRISGRVAKFGMIYTVGCNTATLVRLDAKARAIVHEQNMRIFGTSYWGVYATEFPY